MKLTLEPTINNGAAFAHWVEVISDIIDTAITSGELADTPTTHRLAWNLCTGTLGAVNASVVMCEHVDLSTRIEDIVSPHLPGPLASLPPLSQPATQSVPPRPHTTPP